MMRLATFNVQNMRLRTRGSEVHLDGARDADVLQNSGVDAVALDEVDRSLTAAVLREADADVVALQEVFDQATLDYFHDNVLILSGAQPYPYRVCPPGNDGRGMDVAVISRLPFDFVASHADATPASLGLQGVDAVGADDRIFRRDCLEVTVGPLTLFVCHFKAPDRRSAATSSIRRLEALAVRRLVERRFSDVRAGLWLIAGDLNEPPKGRADSKQAIAPLLDPFSVDLLSRLPREERWSYYQPGLYSRPDALLASPELARRYADAKPRIIRVGLGWETDRYPGKRLAGVGEHRPHASDHAALAIEFAGVLARAGDPRNRADRLPLAKKVEDGRAGFGIELVHTPNVVHSALHTRVGMEKICTLHYIPSMKDDTIQIRLKPSEKEAFVRASDIAGISLSAWVRERLRLASARELEAVGERAPFIEALKIGRNDA